MDLHFVLQFLFPSAEFSLSIGINLFDANFRITKFNPFRQWLCHEVPNTNRPVASLDFPVQTEH